jgi:ornithine carbamoyltransferase
MSKARHFLSGLDLNSVECRQLMARAIELKQQVRQQQYTLQMPHKVLAMIFEKSSTRTRVSFETAMLQCGGGSIFLSSKDSQLGRGEPIADTARVLSSMVDAIVIRTFAHSTIETLAQHSRVPVINALTDFCHPCQLLADMQTFFELRGDIQGAHVCWIGDGNNMCHAYIHAAERFDFQLHIACPLGYMPDAQLLQQFKHRVTVHSNAMDAARQAQLVTTDVWASMGQENEQQIRAAAFADYQVTEQLLDQAHPDVLFMHCLPAHRGEEISLTLLDDPRSVVWQQAENRLHSQKALLELLFSTQG